MVHHKFNVLYISLNNWNYLIKEEKFYYHGVFYFTRKKKDKF